MKILKKQKNDNLATIAFIAAIALMPSIALAGGAPWDNMATNILGIFTGGLARTIAILAVIALGIGAMAGKLAWDTAIKVILGIVLIFGSATIVDLLAGWSA